MRQREGTYKITFVDEEGIVQTTFVSAGERFAASQLKSIRERLDPNATMERVGPIGCRQVKGDHRELSRKDVAVLSRKGVAF